MVADRTKIFFDEKKARAVRDCLNEQDAEIVRALCPKNTDRKEQNNETH